MSVKLKSLTAFVFLFSFFAFCNENIFAQNDAVLSGTITDSAGKPMEGANISLFGLPVGTMSGADGKYSLSVPAGQIKIIFSYAGLKTDSFDLKLKAGEKRTINRTMKSSTTQLPEVVVKESSVRTLNMTSIPPKLLSHIPTPNQSVIDIIKTMPGVSSSNELSSGYSVRGGNYDENLVYVNDIEIYRPFLVRSGQQEGLSFTNSDMVSSIYFSAGGFDAVYGDKMSSVLDIQYRKPEKSGGAFNFSLLGGSLELENASKNKSVITWLGSVTNLLPIS